MYKCAHCSRTFFTYQWASRAAMFWIICEFTRFLLAKTKRVRRLLSRSPNSSQFAIPPMAKSQVRQLSPLSPCETSPCFFGNPIKRSLRGADTNAFMSSCLTSASDENYISLINSAILIILCTQHLMLLRNQRIYYHPNQPEVTQSERMCFGKQLLIDSQSLPQYYAQSPESF